MNDDTRGGESGAAMVEMAVMTPLLTVICLWSIYFWEMQQARIKAAEAARYGAWEATMRPAQMGAILTELKSRYKDLDGSSKTGNQGVGYFNKLTILGGSAVVDRPSPLADQQLSSQASGVGGFVSAFSAMMGNALTPVLAFIGFDVRAGGAVKSSVEFQMKNNLIPTKIATLVTRDGGTGPLDLTFKDQVFLYHDTWRAVKYGDGPANAAYDSVQRNTFERVKKVAYLGITSGPASSVLSGVGSLMRTLQLDWPLDNTYIQQTVLIRSPMQNTRYGVDGAGVRTAPGDRLQAPYWKNGTGNGDLGRRNGEPQAIRKLRDQNNRAYRAYNCRGNFFGGTTQAGTVTEFEYAYSSTRQEQNVFNFRGPVSCATSMPSDIQN